MIYRVSDDVAWVAGCDFVPDDDDIYLMVVPDGLPSVMNGPGAVVFRAVAEGRDPVEAAVEVSGLPAEGLADGIRGFLRELEQRRYIRRVDDDSP